MDRETKDGAPGMVRVQWGQVFVDEMFAAAVLDPCVTATSCSSKESYRLRQKKRAGLIGNVGAESPSTEQPCGDGFSGARGMVLGVVASLRHRKAWPPMQQGRVARP
jgi:hypothetical protein